MGRPKKSEFERELDEWRDPTATRVKDMSQLLDRDDMGRSRGERKLKKLGERD